MNILFLSIFLLLGLCFLANYFRAQDKHIKELTPNCLLTRYPVVFVPGPQSFFYFLKYWNQIPHFLASHGYEVFSLHLPWRSRSQRVCYLQKALASNPQKIHLFFDQGSTDIVMEILKTPSSEKISSLTWIRAKEDSDMIHSELKGLAIPIEELVVTSVPTSLFGGLIQNLLWKIHLLMTSQNLGQSIQTRGFRLGDDFKSLLLERTQLLAERDLIRGSSTSNL